MTVRLFGLLLVFVSLALVGVDYSRNPAAWTWAHGATLGDIYSWLAASLQLPAGRLPTYDPTGQTAAQQLLRLPVWICLGGVGLLALSLGALTGSKNVPRASDGNSGTTSPLAASAAFAGRPGRTELSVAFASFRRTLLVVALFSGLINILMLTGAFFILEVYDRVLPSRSVATLLALAILVALLFTAQGVLDVVRNRVMVRIGASLDVALGPRVFDALLRMPSLPGAQRSELASVRDLDTVRTFLAGQGPIALFDLPWMPIYLAVIFALHPMIGWTALVGAILLIVLTIATELLSRRPVRAASQAARQRASLSDAAHRNSETVVALGMARPLLSNWDAINRAHLREQNRSFDVTGGLGSVAQVMRLMLQSAVLGVGAYYVIQQEATAGVIIAGATLVARALAPVDLAIGQWRGFVAARQSWRRLNALLEKVPAGETPMTLPPPQNSLVAQNLSAMPPGDRRLVVNDVSLTLTRGQSVGIIGPSGSGKSSFVRLLVGAWQPARGRVLLDGAPLDQYVPDELGRHIGYLSQDVELFAGTLAQNISRFDPDATPEAIIEAATAAGVHSMIIDFPGGYEMRLDDGGTGLSMGQRQRVALARALYKNPFLVVLDEPNSNLDAEGDAALAQAIMSLRKRGSIVVVVAHRPAALASVEFVLVMKKGNAVALGQQDEVLPQFTNQNAARAKPSSPTSGQGVPA